MDDGDRKERETEGELRRQAHRAYMKLLRAKKAQEKAEAEKAKNIASQRKRELAKARMRKFRSLKAAATKRAQAPAKRRSEREQFWRDHETRAE